VNSLPEILPVFPLPGIVLFPGSLLPLHVFEPRYRKLTEDALAAGGHFVIALLAPGWEDDYEGRPPVHPVACAGEIVHSHQLPDGRWYLTLRGLVRVRIESELEGGDYRRARVTPIPESTEGLRTGEAAGPALVELLSQFSEISQDVEIATRGVDPRHDPEVREAVLNSIAMNLAVTPAVRQSLLEMDDLSARLARVRDLVRRTLLERTIVARFRDSAPDDPQVN
jgi:Lon protease-like protein